MVKKKYMIKYPWLYTIYINIIKNYKNNNLHHAITIESYNINNSIKIIWALSKWMFCTQPIGLKNCSKCNNCFLIKKKHPDFYILIPHKKDNYISIECLRNTLSQIQNTPQQNDIKIIWIPNYNTLTKVGINILLKIIEEPPKNTFFFIGNELNNHIHITLKSRLLSYRILEPNEKIGLQWMKKYTTFNKIKCLIALRSNNNNPELAINFLKEDIWIVRIGLYKKIFNLLDTNNFLKLLPLLQNKYVDLKIYWIILLFLDTIKFKKKFIPLLTNLDQLPLIKKITKKYSYNILYRIFFLWKKCRYNLINIKNIDDELLILKNLLQWNNIFQLYT